MAAVATMLGLAAPASTQSGHFITGGGNAPSCTDIGTQVRCTGKGGETFEITLQTPGIASVVCINPAGHRAPGQDTAVDVAGTSDQVTVPVT